MTNSYIENCIELFHTEMKRREYADETIKNYTYCFQTFLNAFESKNSIEEISISEMENFIHSYPNANTQLTFYSSLKIYYTAILKNKQMFKIIARPRRTPIEKLFYDKEEIIHKLSMIRNTKHKAILMLAFSTGMKTYEILNLRIEDIDKKKMIIRIRNTKDEVVRDSPLSKVMLNLLNKYIKLYTPTKYLFNGQNNVKYSSKSCECLVKKWIGKGCSMSILRNSTAVALYKGDTELELIQKQLGLKSLKETKRYVKYLVPKGKIVLPI